LAHPKTRPHTIPQPYFNSIASIADHKMTFSLLKSLKFFFQNINKNPFEKHFLEK
jgi:hypothetical protein